MAFFVPRDFWDYLCPRAWDHLCPAFMELRVNLRCQIVCVYLTCFLNLGLRDNLCPYRTRDYLCPAFRELRANLKCRLVCVSITCFEFVIQGPPVPFVRRGAICTHDCGFICKILCWIYYLLLLLFISF